MEWITVIGLILLGLGLLVLEVIFVPGITIFGASGAVFYCAGIYFGYNYFGGEAGSTILIISGIMAITIFVCAFRSGAWARFSLKQVNSGKVNEDFRPRINVGDEGIAISSLKPMGKAIFNDSKELEVKSNGEYIAENQSIVAIRIESNIIVVKSNK